MHPIVLLLWAAHTHIRTQIRTHTHTYTHIHTNTHTHTHTLIHTCTHTHTHAHIRAHTHTHIHTRTHIHTHTHTRIHTHTHTSARADTHSTFGNRVSNVAGRASSPSPGPSSRTCPEQTVLSQLPAKASLNKIAAPPKTSLTAALPRLLYISLP